MTPGRIMLIIVWSFPFLIICLVSGVYCLTFNNARPCGSVCHRNMAEISGSWDDSCSLRPLGQFSRSVAIG